jgi:hypothetical protein
MPGSMPPPERRTDHRHVAPDLLVRRPPIRDRASVSHLLCFWGQLPYSCLDKERPRGKRLVVGLKGVAC